MDSEEQAAEFGAEIIAIPIAGVGPGCNQVIPNSLAPVAASSVVPPIVIGCGDLSFVADGLREFYAAVKVFLVDRQLRSRRPLGGQSEGSKRLGGPRTTVLCREPVGEFEGVRQSMACRQVRGERAEYVRTFDHDR